MQPISHLNPLVKVPYTPTATHRIPPTTYKILMNQKLKKGLRLQSPS
jgi:hypothetical protein